MKKTLIFLSILTIFAMFFTVMNVSADHQPWQKRSATQVNHPQKTLSIHGDNDENENFPGGGQLSQGNKHKKTPLEEATETTPTPLAHVNARLNFHGTIDAVSTDLLTLMLADGSTVDFILNSNTVVHIPSFASTSVSDLAVGNKIMVKAVLGEGGALTAYYIQVIPAVQPPIIHYMGTVTAYTPGSSITIMDKYGQSVTLTIVSTTRILPEEMAASLGVGAMVNIFVSAGSSEVTAVKIVIQSTAIPSPTQIASATVEGTPTETPTETATLTETATGTSTTTATSTTTSTPTLTPTTTATETATSTATIAAKLPSSGPNSSWLSNFIQAFLDLF